jgi:hypothetical protein
MGGIARTGLGQAQAGDTVYALHGTVVDGVSGKPVARALVQSADRRLASLSDGDGHFSFEIRVPAGGAAKAAANPALDEARDVIGLRFLDSHGVMLLAEKPGYLPSAQGKMLAIDGTLPATEVKLTLMPAAGINGRVTASATDVAAGVGVTLYRRLVGDDGRLRWTQAGLATTNGRGEFHFANLQPGEYTLNTVEWRGEQPLERQHNVVSEGYPPVFNGDARTLAEAARIRLHYGDEGHAEIHIQDVPFYPVTIPLGLAAGGASGGAGARVLDSGYELEYAPKDNAVEGWLPDGHYVVAAAAGGPQPLSAVVAINVAGGPVVSKPVTLAPVGKIMVRVHNEMTRPAPAEPAQGAEAPDGTAGDGPPIAERGNQRGLTSIFLIPEANDGIQTGSNGDDLTLQGVDPGRYTVRTALNRGYVAAMSSGGVDLLQQPLVVNDHGSAAPIDVTLRDDTASVKGTILPGGAPLPEFTSLFFLPADMSGQMHQGFARADGKFSVDDLAPGRYRVLAFPGRVRALPYREADAMQPLEGKGVDLQAGPNQALEIDVPLLSGTLPDEWRGGDDDLEL